MSEQLPDFNQLEFRIFNQLEFRIPANEELQHGRGLSLQPYEGVMLPNCSPRTYRHEVLSTGEHTVGAIYADIEVGGAPEGARARIIKTLNKKQGERAYLDFWTYPTGKSLGFCVELIPGQLVGIGREFEGQDMLPDTVSRMHCAVGINSVHRIAVINGNPTNHTVVHAYGIR